MLAFAMMAAIQRHANKPTPKKTNAPAHSLVGPRNPAHRTSPRAKTIRSRLHHRMVAVAARPPSRRTNVAYQKEITTV